MDEQIARKVDEHGTRLSALESSSAEVKARLTSVEGKVNDLNEKVEDIHKIATSVELIAHDMSYMKTDISEVKTGQGELKSSQEELKKEIMDVKNEPEHKLASKVDSLKDKILWLLIGGILIYVLTQAFPNIKW